MGLSDRRNLVETAHDNRKRLDDHAKVLESHGTVQKSHSRAIADAGFDLAAHKREIDTLRGRNTDLDSRLEDLEFKLEHALSIIGKLQTFGGLFKALIRRKR